MSRRTTLAALAVVAALALASCGVGGEERARTEDDGAVPFGLLDRNQPPLLPPTTAPSTTGVPVCFVDDGDLVTLQVALDSPADLTDIARSLAEPPTGSDRSVRTATGDATLVREVTLAKGVAEVDLRRAIETLAGDEQLLAVGQLVCTLTEQPGVGLVSFTLDGSPIDVPRGDGSLTSGAVSRDDYADLFG